MKSILVLLFMITTMGVLEGRECPRYDKMIDLGAEAISYTLQCRNYRGVRRDLDRFGKSLGFCPDLPGEKGVIAEITCPIIGRYAASQVAKQLPMRWLCDPQVAKKVVEVIVSKNCKQIIPY